MIIASSPVYIFGPCSAESREQVIRTAGELTAACCQLSVSFIFRAGVWKPRTRPNTFQGAGEEGLTWLQEVKERYGLPVATEVATSEHIEAAMQAGMDYVWIGARTSANPIAVQMIADTLSRLSRKPKAVLVKNPVNADAALWLGNMERIEKTGIPVMAIHRGCDHQPCWHVAHTIRTARPDIPMLLDPSHMSGEAKRVKGLWSKIAELGLDGAMIEVHCDPENALSDAKQQVKPSVIRHQLSEMRLQAEHSELHAIELNWLRAEIDELDETLWQTIADRMEVSRRIGEWKKAHNVSPLQPDRYREIVERLHTKGENLGLSPEFMHAIWDLIHEESLKQQK